MNKSLELSEDELWFLAAVLHRVGAYDDPELISGLYLKVLGLGCTPWAWTAYDPEPINRILLKRKPKK